MTKTAKEVEEHQLELIRINNELGAEYGRWFGFPIHSPVGRYLALGEYLVELCKFEPHDEWFDSAKAAYLKWKEEHGYPANLQDSAINNQ